MGQNRELKWALVNKVVTVMVIQNVGNFLANISKISLPGSTSLRDSITEEIKRHLKLWKVNIITDVLSSFTP